MQPGLVWKRQLNHLRTAPNMKEVDVARTVARSSRRLYNAVGIWWFASIMASTSGVNSVVRAVVPKQTKKIHEDSCSTNPALWCDWCGLKFPHRSLREKHQRRCPRNPEKTCRFCGEEFESVMAELMHRVFCAKNPSTKTILIDCAACCEKSQCIVFPCGAHHYCSRCLLRMARIGIKDRTQLPLHCCKHEVKPGDAVDLAIGQLLPDAHREKYQEAMLVKFAKDVMYCPQHDCGALIVLDELNNSSLDVNGPIGCPQCCYPLCHRCKSEWHAGMTCDQYHYISDKSRDAFTRFCRDMRWMRCFECGHVVEKRAGCNHITCMRGKLLLSLWCELGLVQMPGGQ